MLLYRIGLISAVMFLLPVNAYGQDADRQRVFEIGKNVVASLRVWGTAASDAVFDAQEPPLFGTGFLIRTDRPDAKGKYRIITAAHVVARDEMWEKRPNGVARTIYPSWLTRDGPVQAGVYRAVARHHTSDIAQIPYDLSGREPAAVRFASIVSGGRYFVVSFGLDEFGDLVNQPYIRETKVVSLQKVESGFVGLKIIDRGNHAFFKKSESGSPVFDLGGNVVGIIIKLLDPEPSEKGLSTIGIALPLAGVADWIAEVKSSPIKEPAEIQAYRLPITTKLRVLPALKGAAIFLGKYSARELPAGSRKILEDAPFGVDYLRQVIAFFKQEDPKSIQDANASVSKKLGAPQSVPLLGRIGAVNIRSLCIGAGD